VQTKEEEEEEEEGGEARAKSTRMMNNKDPNRTDVKLVLASAVVIMCTMGYASISPYLRHPDLVYSSQVIKGAGDASTSMLSSGLNNQNQTNSSILNVNANAGNMHYTWIGNQWVPPHGVPIYSVIEMRALYERYSTVWMGDSTSRRAYHTLYGMLNASDPSDVSIHDIDDGGVIDLGKGAYTQNCTNPNYFPWTNDTARGILFQPHHMICRKNADSRLDLFLGAQCFSDIDRFARTDLEYGKKTSQDYDILIVAMGIWELVRRQDCRRNNNETDTGKRLEMALKSLSDLSSPKLRIVWRTMGFSDKYAVTKDEIKIYNKFAKDFIETQPYMSCVDWGGEIERRSFGNSRIRGGMTVHYGPEARTLLINMLTHELASLKINEA
jgi:hypothetical protein